jgi:two-component system phosphate regulon response regulator PhoB
MHSEPGGSDIRLLVIDGDKNVLDLVVQTFVNAGGFKVSTASNGREGCAKAVRELPNLIILEMELAKTPGLEVARFLSVDSRTRHIPIVMLSARAEEIDRILGWEMGAADYVTKPFSSRELVLRVRAILRRSESQSPSESLRAGPVMLDIARHAAMVEDRPIRLTTVEYKLLTKLMETPHRAHARNRLLREVWGYSREANTRTIDTHVRRLRKKFGKHGGVIETVRGFGYRLVKD